MKIKLDIQKQHTSNKGRSIRYIIIHGSGKASLNDLLRHFQDPSSNVSAHYVIGIDGECIQFVDESEIAWHAGISKWKNDRSLNYTSIGIELFNPTAGRVHPYSDLQYECLAILTLNLMEKYNIPLTNVLGHSDIAPDRRTDPGKLFDWDRFKSDLLQGTTTE